MKTKINALAFLLVAGTLQATTLSFSTFLGGSSTDKAYSLALDGSENAYIGGYTSSNGFPTTAGAFDTSPSGSGDAFVSKFNSTGTELSYSTFFGGPGGGNIASLAVDGCGNAYIGGFTGSSDFPTTSGAFDTSFNGGNFDAFVSKLNSLGTGLSYSTFLGESDTDYASFLAIDGSGNAYIGGYTNSSDFPTTAGAFDTSFNGGLCDAFVSKLNSTGTGLSYSTFLGGSSIDLAYSLAVDGNGNAYIGGETFSSGFPTTAGAFDTSQNGNTDAFVSKLNSTGTGLSYSTFLGGSSEDYAYSLAVDGSENAYIGGYTVSSGFPTTAGAFDISQNGWYDAFVSKLNSTGTGLSYSTFLGGLNKDKAWSLAVDGSGNACIGGETYSSGFPTTAGAFDTSQNGSSYTDTFVSKLNSTGSALAYSTFLGGASADYAHSLAVDGSGNAYIGGETQASDFPTTSGAFDTSYNGGSYDAFVVKFDFFTAVTEQNNFAKEFQLNQNFPNPFNPNTTIFYTLVKANNVKLEVFNTKGKLVQTLVSEKQNEGSHSSNWNGKDENGNAVSSGVYFYKLTAGNYTQTNKMILLK